MKYSYGEFDGQPFVTPDDLFPSPQVVRFILQHGQSGLDAIQQQGEDDDEVRQLIEAMLAAGLLERDEKTGGLRLTPKMVRGIEHRALLEIFDGLQRGNKEGHTTLHPGRGDERTDGSKTYEFGDPLSQIDLGATMRNVLHRHLSPRERSVAQQPGEGSRTTPADAAAHKRDSTDHAPVAPNPHPGPLPKAEGVFPLHITPDDFELHLTEGNADVAMCILLDMSGSMMRWGRFFQAKRVALGMAALMRKRFPQDTIDFVGFYSTACRIREEELPLVMPKPVTVHDYVVRLRVPLQEAMADPKRVPQHFTNLQLGLRLAQQALARRGAANKQIFIITDGQPTAHVQPSPTGDGDMLYLLYPPAEETTMLTLKEALRCQQRGIRIATFALVEDYWGMDWVGFVDQLTRLTRGAAFYCSSEDLTSTVIESYLNGKRRKSFIA